MEIKTKYNIGDKVFYIKVKNNVEEKICHICNGIGTTTIQEESFICPKCDGKGYLRSILPATWQVCGPLTIGQVQVTVKNFKKDKTQIFDNIGDYSGEGNNEQEVMYMTYETGIGTGTCWPEESFFINPAKAEEEAERRNQTRSDYLTERRT